MRGKRQDWSWHSEVTMELGAGEVMEVGRCVTAVMGYRAHRVPAPRKPDLGGFAAQTPAHPCLLKPEQLMFFWVIMSV